MNSIVTLLAALLLTSLCLGATSQNRLILLHPGTEINTETTPSVQNVHTTLHQKSFVNRKQLYLVQVKENLTRTERQAIEASIGAALKNYLPHNTYLCALSDPVAAQAVEGVLWIGEYHNSYKTLSFSPSFLSTSPLKSKSLKGPEFTVLAGQKTTSTTSTSSPESSSLTVFFPEGDANQYRSEILSSLQQTFGAEFGSVGQSSGEVLVVSVNSPDILSAVVDSLSEHPMVGKVEKKKTFKLLNRDASWVTQSNVASKYSVHDQGIHGENQIIGVADSGIDYDHCMFNDPAQSVAFNGANTAHRKIIGYNYYTATDDHDDVDGHGTHVVGSIAGEALYTASATNQTAAAAFNGVAYKSKIVFTDLEKTGAGSLSTPNDLNQLFQPAYNLGARIFSNSWGCSANPPSDCNIYDTDARNVDKFMWDNPDMLILFAAGNDGDSGSNTVGSPATAKNCLSVGATRNDLVSFQTVPNYLDIQEVLPTFCSSYNTAFCPQTQDCCTQSEAFCCQKGYVDCCRSNFQIWTSQQQSVLKTSNLAYFSSRGPGSKTNSARIKPDVVAPGERVISAHSDGNTKTFQCGTSSPSLANDAALLSMQGTSMATPITAGAAALVRQYFTEGFYPTGSKNTTNAMTSVSSSLIKAIMVASTVDLNYYTDNSWSTSQTMPASPNKYEGFGRVQLDQALRFSNSAFSLFVADKKQLSGGDAHTYTVTASPDYPLKIVMTYNDYYSLVDTALVNNLDLSVTGPSGTVSWGNGVSGGDPNNVIERVVYAAPSKGTYTIKVSGTTIGHGPQPYALVVTNSVNSNSSPTTTPSPTAKPSSSSRAATNTLLIAFFIMSLLL